MKSHEIREKFLSFFENHGHTRVKSSSLIPAADPTLLFTNAGMVQFKDCFLGTQNNGYQRATTVQKCVRAGGKHNDLENVGFTPRHHTFFEMLGNFSFGDYFKKDAIAYAWEFLTKELSLPKDRLRITIYEKDDEAFELWKAQGVRTDWIERLGEKDNFWAMGDTGPCGPCTEIHFDWGQEYASAGPNGSPGTDSKRFLEIWNLVFMQFNRDTSGKMTPLPKPSVDTGAGLERVASVLQGTYSNYDNDIFQSVISRIADRVKRPYGRSEQDSVSVRVLADHLRSGTFLISDGVVPSNEGRGYVLRRILRRAIRHGKKLGQEQPFLFELVSAVTDSLGNVYPELQQNASLVKTLLKEEETRFHETLHRGMGLLDEAMHSLKKEKRNTLPGDIAFKLYDTFGFPYDLIEVICQEQSLFVDQSGFDKNMERQRAQSAGSMGSVSEAAANLTKSLMGKQVETRFLGYERLTAESKLDLLFDAEGNSTKELSNGKRGFAVFTETPFYAESGGQVGDRGFISSPDGAANVLTTNKNGKTFIHSVETQTGTLRIGQMYRLTVDEKLRQSTAVNHTATHMLHAALRNVLGDRVKQAGSLVDDTKLRFDFTYPRAVTHEELAKIETLVNTEVRKFKNVTTKEMSYDDAVKSGALAFFDEKYGDRVRVVRVGDENAFSVELCGGTHLRNTADIALIKVISESSVASGVRRIEAITADKAIQYYTERDELLNSIEAKLGNAGNAGLKKLEQILDESKSLQKEVEKLKLQLAQSRSRGGDGNQETTSVKYTSSAGIRLVVDRVPDANPKILRTLVDQIRDKMKDKTVVALATEVEGKVSLCIGLTKDIVGTLDAAALVKGVAEHVGGTGGGRSDFAQAGGNNPGGISKAFEALQGLLG